MYVSLVERCGTKMSETLVCDMAGQLRSPADVKRFMYAGNAIFTIRSKKTGNRFTYKVRRSDFGEKIADPKAVWFVSVLNGPDNWTNYAYMGIIKTDQKEFNWTKKARVGEDAASWIAFKWLFTTINEAPIFLNSQVEIWHEGKCGRCGRKLTVPESVERGIGPDCAEKM